MTPAGQCRLAPLIPLIQDSNPLYDHLVRIMFRLHANLPPDLLNGHRTRFLTIFHQLKNFYTQTRILQYFENLITVPKLPENPPNFLIQSDFGNYTAPVVVMPDETQNHNDEEMSVQELIDTSDSPPEPPPRDVPPEPPAVDFEKVIQDRDNMIMHLQSEIQKLSSLLKRASVDHREQQSRIEDQYNLLQSELLQTREELTNLRIMKEELELKAQTAPTLERKYFIYLNILFNFAISLLSCLPIGPGYIFPKRNYVLNLLKIGLDLKYLQ